MCACVHVHAPQHKHVVMQWIFGRQTHTHTHTHTGQINKHITILHINLCNVLQTVHAPTHTSITLISQLKGIYIIYIYIG